MMKIMSESAVSKFETFRKEYEDRQVDRPKPKAKDPEILHLAAREYGARSLELLKNFFTMLTSDEKEELLEDLDLNDPLNREIVKQAQHQFLIRS